MRDRTIVALAALALLGATSAGVSFVPWKVVKPGDEPPATPLILWWVPASRDDMKHSELLSSRALMLYASQCVAMELVPPEDSETIDRLGAADVLPVAVLTDREGHGLARAESSHGVLRASAVEDIVRGELDARASKAERLLDEADEKTEAGERDQAIALYRQVVELRCLCPRQGKEAVKALKRLGVEP